MTNFEYDFIKNPEAMKRCYAASIAVRATDKQTVMCSELNGCRECLFYKDRGDCFKKRLEWLDEESKRSTYITGLRGGKGYIMNQIRSREQMVKMVHHRYPDPAEAMTRSEILQQAEQIVCSDREKTYGKPENNFGTIAKYWKAYKGVKFSAHDVAMMMALLKIARIQNGEYKPDNYIDLAGYTALAGELGGK